MTAAVRSIPYAPPSCDRCGEPATLLVSAPENGMGGDPKYGSFRSYLCDPHADEAIEANTKSGFRVNVVSVLKRRKES